jgi:putative sterol carrier protein
MEYLEEMTAKFKSAIASGSTPDKSLKINLKDTGVIVVDSTSVTNEDVAADTTISISRKDFDSLVAGKLNPPVAVTLRQLFSGCPSFSERTAEQQRHVARK